jgi:hypothetical protein
VSTEAPSTEGMAEAAVEVAPEDAAVTEEAPKKRRARKTKEEAE